MAKKKIVVKAVGSYLGVRLYNRDGNIESDYSSLIVKDLPNPVEIEKEVNNGEENIKARRPNRIPLSAN